MHKAAPLLIASFLILLPPACREAEKRRAHMQATESGQLDPEEQRRTAVEKAAAEKAAAEKAAAEKAAAERAAAEKAAAEKAAAEQRFASALENMSKVNRESVQSIRGKTWRRSEPVRHLRELSAAMDTAIRHDISLPVLESLAAAVAALESLKSLEANPPRMPHRELVSKPERRRVKYDGVWRLSGRYVGPMDTGGIIVRRGGRLYHVVDAVRPHTPWQIPISGYVRDLVGTSDFFLDGSYRFADRVQFAERWEYVADQETHRNAVRAAQRNYSSAMARYRAAERQRRLDVRNHRTAEQRHRSNHRAAVKKLVRSFPALVREVKRQDWRPKLD